jgi:hypothetical protein
MCGVGLHLPLSIYLSLCLWTCKDYVWIHVCDVMLVEELKNLELV